MTLPLILLLVVLGGSDEDLRRLGSPYAAERDKAVADLIAAKPDDGRLVPLLAHQDPRMRLGAARVLRETGSAGCLDAIVNAWKGERDSMVARGLAVAFFGVTCRVGGAGSAAFEATAKARAGTFAAAARGFVEDELREMEKRQVRWSHHRELRRFRWMGRFAAPALQAVLMDEGQRTGVRCLAAVALGRVDAPGMWVGSDGQPGAPFLKLLADAADDIKMAVLYAAAYNRVTNPSFVREVARFCVEDSFDANMSQAALYYLYTLPKTVIPGVKDELGRCVEANATAFSEMCVYNAGVLLAQMDNPALAEKLAFEEAVLTDNNWFGDYWIYGAVIEHQRRAAGGKWSEKLGRILAKALAHEKPQVRALGAWWWRDLKGELPPGVDLEGLLAEVRDSCENNKDTDADCYAQRGGVEILAYFNDAEAPPLFEKLLDHENEAVRMATGVACATAKFDGLRDALLEAADEKGEYGAYGACYGLSQMKDERCIPVLIEIIGSGNGTLMGAALADLRSLTGHEVAAEVPRTQVAWQARAEAWAAWAAARKKP